MKLALRFQALTVARTEETRLAEWCDVDLDAAVWNRPAAKMKTGVAHRQPLSSAAVKVLRSAQKLGGGARYIFPGRVPETPITPSVYRLWMQKLGCSSQQVRAAFWAWCPGVRGHDQGSR